MGLNKSGEKRPKDLIVEERSEGHESYEGEEGGTGVKNAGSGVPSTEDLSEKGSFFASAHRERGTG